MEFTILSLSLSPERILSGYDMYNISRQKKKKIRINASYIFVMES